MNPRAIGVNPVARIGTIVKQLNSPIVMSVDTAVTASFYDSLSEEQKQAMRVHLLKVAREGR